jgi:hypothetical protein
VADTSPARGRWASRPVPPEPPSIAALIRGGTLDAELAATVWLLLGGRVPLIVAGDGDGDGVGRTDLLRALLDFVAPDIRLVELAGSEETFDWLPQASELGWPGAAPVRATGVPVRADDTVLLASELSDRSPGSTWGEAARIAIRAASIGYGLAATIPAGSLDDVFALLRSAPVHLTDDELSRLGMVLVVGRTVEDRHRVVAAHYVRPVARDVHGHLQRLGPAVLSTWDERTDTFEQFGWGVTPELASRIGLRAGDFELELGARRLVLEGLVRDALTGGADVRAAVARHLATSTILPAGLPAGSSAVQPH